MSPSVDLPTERIIWGGPYVSPTHWHRTVPCSCNNCPDCIDGHIEQREPLMLTIEDAGNCYSGCVPYLMPELNGTPGYFCVKIGCDGPVAARVDLYENQDGGGVYFVVNGVAYNGYITINHGEACICYLDKTHWVVTGTGVTGFNGGGGG